MRNSGSGLAVSSSRWATSMVTMRRGTLTWMAASPMPGAAYMVSTIESMKAFMDSMVETMYAAPGIGLAAIQVNVPRRIVTIDVAQREDENASPDPLFLINPEILWSSDERALAEEGCLSIPEYFAEVERPASVRVAYLDRDGKRREMQAEGVLAVCLQHEIDHLDGKLFIDHLSKLKRDMVIRKFAKQARVGPKPPVL